MNSFCRRYRFPLFFLHLSAWILCFSLLLSLAGCALFETGEELPADVLVSEGMYEFEKGDYRDAIDAFQKLRDWYPFSKYAILAELKIADAHFRLDEYEEAAAAYEQFERLHPKNEAVPYVVYQIGSCCFKRMQAVDRDQTAARNALDAYERLVRQHPDDEYARRARLRIRDCYLRLAGHEFYVGRYYYRAGEYKAAMERFRTVLMSYPDEGIHKDAMAWYARCRQKLAGEAGSGNGSAEN